MSSDKGRKLTPREATNQMLDAGYLTLNVSKGIYLTLPEVWQAMHDAAPVGPSEIESLRTQLAAEQEQGERLRAALSLLIVYGKAELISEDDLAFAEEVFNAVTPEKGQSDDK